MKFWILAFVISLMIVSPGLAEETAGDIDDDGKIGVHEVINALKVLVNGNAPEPSADEADITGDAKVTLIDAIAALQFASGTRGGDEKELPSSAFVFGSGLFGLLGLRRKFRKNLSK